MSEFPTQPGKNVTSGEGLVVHSMPQPFGRYVLVERLGVGGMGEVFRAQQDGPAGFQRELVIKRLLPHHAEDKRLVKMFLQEAEVIAKLHHSNIVQVFELGEHDEQYFIAMEYINGLSLYQIARRAWDAQRGLPLELCLSAVADAARGLSYASHLLGPTGEPLRLVHRDVTPENLMINREGLTKVLDFGVARLATSDRTTKHGEVKGKIPFLAPEQIAGQEATHQSDLYSLGVTLYWLLTGRRPFRADSDLWLMEAILDEQPAPPRKLNPEIPKPIEDWILCLLAKSPADRPADGAELADALMVDQHIPRARLGAFVADMADTEEVPRDQGEDEPGFVPSEPMAEELLAAVQTVPQEVLERAQRSKTQRARKAARPQQLLMVGLGGLVVALFALVIFLIVRDRGPATVTTTTPAAAADAGPRVIAPTTSDAGRTQPDAGAEAAEGEGEGEGEDVGDVATPRTMRVTAPGGIRFKTARGKTLGRGSGVLTVPPGNRSVYAHDTKRGWKVRVPVRSRWRFAQLKKGKLSVRVYPYADVYVGQTKLGSTPLKTQDLLEGVYRMRFVADGKTKTQTVRVRPGRTERVRVNMSE